MGPIWAPVRLGTGPNLGYPVFGADSGISKKGLPLGGGGGGLLAIAKCFQAAPSGRSSFRVKQI